MLPCAAAHTTIVTLTQEQVFVAVQHKRVLITGGGTFFGDNIAAALIAQGIDVTLLVRPGLEGRTDILAQRTNMVVADVWDIASLKGRARGHSVVIHTVGSLVENPQQGLTYHRVNFVSARNVVTMCISDGVPRMILMSSVRAPWIKRSYIRSKREAEQYLGRVGVAGTVIRAPITYVRGQQRPLFFRLMTLLGSVPPISWFGFGRIAPMPIDILARGVAQIASQGQMGTRTYFAGDLRRIVRAAGPVNTLPLNQTPQNDDTKPRAHPFELLDEDSPFGWMPSDKE